MRSVTCLLQILVVIAGTALWLGCRHGKPQPVDIVLSEDSCAECRMAVSDMKFAAEVVTPSGHVDYFDDIGCLVLRLRTQPPEPHSGIYVGDFNSGKWLENDVAYYLWSKDLSTPMSYGLAALADQTAAQKASEKWRGEVLRWSDLLVRYNQ